ncbi:hypothetical protein ACTVJH_11230 [Desulfoplanes sp. PS50]|jgi:hypothetical protein
MSTKQPTTRVNHILGPNLHKGSHSRAHARFFCLRCYSPLETVRT